MEEDQNVCFLLYHNITSGRELSTQNTALVPNEIRNSLFQVKYEIQVTWLACSTVEEVTQTFIGEEQKKVVMQDIYQIRWV